MPTLTYQLTVNGVDVRNNNIVINLTWIDRNVVPNKRYPREYSMPYDINTDLSAVKAFLRAKRDEFYAERATANQFSPFIGNTYTEEQLV